MPQSLRSKFNARRPAGMAIATAVLLGLVAAGCGSSDNSSSSSTTTPAITKAQFLARANAICTQGNRVTDAAGAKLGQKPTHAQVVALARTDATAIQAQITSIRTLGAPSGDAATVTKFLDLAQADLNKVKANPTLLVAGKDPFADFAKVAHPYGLTACDKAD